MIEHEQDATRENDRTALPARTPWVKPVVVSGEAFERVQLNSGCDTGIFDGCEVPCDA